MQLLSEYVGGGTLFTWLQHQVPMPLDMLRYCTRETLDGLAYLHSNAVIHEELRVTTRFYVLTFCIHYVHQHTTTQPQHAWPSVIFCRRSYCLEFASGRAPRSRLYIKHFQTVA